MVSAQLSPVLWGWGRFIRSPWGEHFPFVPWGGAGAGWAELEDGWTDRQTDTAGKSFLWLLLKGGGGFFMPDVFGKS